MNIHEYQGKEIFRKFGVPVPEGQVAFNADEASAIARKLFDAGSKVVVVKAQIHAGGRGKAGGVKLVKSPDEAKQFAKELIGRVLVTHQTGPEGKEVKKVLVEAGSKIKKEYYFAILVDRAIGWPTVIASTEGGMDIEHVAATSPEKILKEAVDPAVGMMPYQARKLTQRLGLTGELAGSAAKLILGVYKTFIETDASLVEINPLVIAELDDGKEIVVALDAKMNFDDNALYRHKDIVAMRDLNEEEPLETRANAANLNYIKLDGTIACMVNGAGLAMATMDIIKHCGGNPANFLDVGGGATEEQVTEAFKILLADKNVKAILINIFGGIMKCDVIATGIITAAREVKLPVPLVVRLEGTNVERGKKLLKESGLPIITADGMFDAAQKVVGATMK
ncbi:MAG: ADP-forming succinate--CoA ligase subunit beta [Verrucomicrobiae bacterium]|nr:ADP-forming succinate--CoA ligase subunit beta [Verrucomicrobiae bacterium]